MNLKRTGWLAGLLLPGCLGAGSARFANCLLGVVL
jgi:hypothetical protein